MLAWLFIIASIIVIIVELRYATLLNRNHMDMRMITGKGTRYRIVCQRMLMCMLVFYCSNPYVTAIATISILAAALIWVCGFYLISTHPKQFLEIGGVEKLATEVGSDGLVSLALKNTRMENEVPEGNDSEQ